MEVAIFALLGGFVILLSVILFRALNKERPENDAALGLMQQQLDQLRQQLSTSLTANTQSIQEQMTRMTTEVNSQLNSVNRQLSDATGQIGTRLDHAARVVGEVKQNLGEMAKATQQVYDVGKDIAGLQEILRAPKLRGNLGELFLGELLTQVLPPTQYTLQHRFKSNEVVDAVILLGPAWVPVDSKFPLENFKKLIEAESAEGKKTHRRKFRSDVKKHINRIASKYILPEEGTYDFALMYIPAENVYYETIIKDETFGDENALSSYALTKQVVPVSPNSFYAYLQAIVLGFKGLRIEKSAKEIHQRLQQLGGDFHRFKEDFDVLGRHLSNTKGKYEEASKKLDRLGERLLAVDEERTKPTTPKVGRKESNQPSWANGMEST